MIKETEFPKIYTLYLWRQNKLAMVGTVLVAFFILIAIFAPLIAPYDPIEVDLSGTLLPPSSEHIFGTDQFGRDIFSRVVYGARIEVGIILLVTVISGTIGLAVGITAGYFGGVIDDVLMRITDVFLSFPNLILAMALSAMLGRGVFNAIIAISLVGWTIIARLARAESMKVKSLPYIEAIRALGASNIRILLLHILPMCMSPVLVQLSLRMGSIILTAAGLGFLGLGAQPPTPEWGAIVSDGRSYLVDQWWISTFPGLFIALVVLGFNLLGDGIRDMMDPRIRR
ncbi:MAG TPA: ABC transporter permease [Acetomicrobium hydrogeniformans]|uniref:ABC transporter permease n=1 Tax=Acetomicrobium hydrogeniformans TaxID=649746 RepID=A0A7V6ZDW9_9BACT|nr:ABC transporter permease [Acetomicrobium hydrogeniformans]